MHRFLLFRLLLLLAGRQDELSCMCVAGAATLACCKTQSRRAALVAATRETERASEREGLLTNYNDTRAGERVKIGSSLLLQLTASAREPAFCPASTASQLAHLAARILHALTFKFTRAQIGLGGGGGESFGLEPCEQMAGRTRTSAD